MATSFVADRPLQGRKKYLGDLANLGEVSSRGGLQFSGFRIADLRVGDDEGAFRCHILDEQDERIVSLDFLISDTSEYPHNHTFFCHSVDEDAPSEVLQTIAELPEDGSRSIEEMLKRLLGNMTKVRLGSDSILQDEDEGEDVEYDYDEFDDHSDAGFGIFSTDRNAIDVKLLQHDFVDIVGFDYRPGFIQFGVDEFAISVALPVIALTRHIPPRALMAWDRRLLSKTQHLTLLIHGFRGMYPILQPDGSMSVATETRGVSPQFRVGLTANYKPKKEHVVDAVRLFGLQVRTEASPQREPPLDPPLDTERRLDHELERSTFQSFSLSSSLETLLKDHFFDVLRLRLKYDDLGWAGAEVLCWEAKRQQSKPQDVIKLLRQQIKGADDAEEELSRSYNLPPDPLLVRDRESHLNLPLIAFSYLFRRLMLCSRYCIVCHNKLSTDYEALKPYLCDNKLCTYQYYSLNQGPSLEYEICTNPETVDLLVSLAYTSAVKNELDDPLPVGMGLCVPHPDPTPLRAPNNVCDFDTLDKNQMRRAIVKLLDKLPPIADMKNHLEKPVAAGNAKPKLKDIDTSIPDAAWSILRWCVASCTAHLEEVRDPEDRIRNIDPSWRQFRFTVGAPDAEAIFKKEVALSQSQDFNAQKYPSLYAFHGSPVENWHSIIRHGLWFKKTVHGRAHGHGVYFAKDGSLSMGSYARTSDIWWPGSTIGVHQCAALAEIVNLPSQFVSQQPFFVVSQTHWIVCRYLLVKASTLNSEAGGDAVPDLDQIPWVSLDPKHPLTLSQKWIQIPEPSYKIERLLAKRQEEYFEVGPDSDDVCVFNGTLPSLPDRPIVPTPPPRDVDEWTHDPEWVSATVQHMLPPPDEAFPQATMALQRELRTMLREQEQAQSLRELGWYMPPEFVGDNLFQWIVEVHSFEKDLPVAKDMKQHGVNSLVFEIRFPPSFPHAPPFFRILKPRFLPFVRGGGGHVTGGGSMCMDLLTADGWLPSYSISAIILQIKLAISNLDPRPARLDENWDRPYEMYEAIEGFKRAARTHGWKIPAGLERLAY
ncbi:uncharacterized protein FIBRA_03609 [Fibroporia radiculosa]|uniref:UBC core domain-containing protein n=1 Tax=Fibroporia radiculosa TaxID=599839 RepID=J4I9Q1_9APHY|nr:uncharacterized protein FIBRA_03609 [Fibroporia radiculosa]CCM01551.1 predicted protein [Fibroporia radiculosa]